MRIGETSAEVLTRVEALCNAWCDRHCLAALRHLLKSWPLPPSPLTDSWAELGIALQNIRAFSREQITSVELQEVEELIRNVDEIVHRRR